MNTDWAHAPNKKGWELRTGLFCSPSRCANSPAELTPSGSRVLTAMMQVNSEPITLSGECQSLAPESTENSPESDSHLHSKCCDVITDKASEEEACGCSTRESPGMNSSPWPPSPASLSGDQSAADFLQWGGWGRLQKPVSPCLNTRKLKDPITYFTSYPPVTVV